MNADVVIIDYGIGNLFSVRRAFEVCGARVAISSEADAILSASRVVLPGVGAFADGMRGLTERGLDKAVVAYADSGRPLLGICLGMQMLASCSEEFGKHAGLGIIPGRVVPVPDTGADGSVHKIPHIGWSPLRVPRGRPAWTNSVLEGVSPGQAVYLVHSYHFVPNDDAHRLADCDYDGITITAAVQKENVYGCQFHPEKSAGVGLGILKKFLSI